jgi:hypothetical protein
VEEASAAAQSMAQQAQGLRAAVAFFKIDVRRVSMSPVNAARKEPHRKPQVASPAKLAKPAATPRLTSSASTAAAAATSANEAADWQTF